MMDLAARAGLNVRAARLEKELGIPVIACEAVHGRGLIELKLAMSRPDLPLARHAWDIPAKSGANSRADKPRSSPMTVKPRCWLAPKPSCS